MPTLADINRAYRRSMARQIARHEAWLAGDWDSRSARGITTMERHRDELARLRIALTTATKEENE